MGRFSTHHALTRKSSDPLPCRRDSSRLLSSSSVPFLCCVTGVPLWQLVRQNRSRLAAISLASSFSILSLGPCENDPHCCGVSKSFNPFPQILGIQNKYRRRSPARSVEIEARHLGVDDRSDTRSRFPLVLIAYRVLQAGELVQTWALPVP